MNDELTAFEKATLMALAEACNYSPNAHVPEEAICKKFQTHLRGDVKKSLKKLCKTNLVKKHPTGRNTTYNITRDGIRKAQE